MIFDKGKNYLFFFANPDSVARITATPEAFYNFPPSQIPEIPALHTEPLLVPRFLYSLIWNRESYPSQKTDIPPYPFDTRQKDPWGILTKPNSFHKGKISLERTKRNKMGAAFYLSLRDFVNPELKENEVIEKIENLYFDAKSKNFLFRLVKILYSGKASEEYGIVSNLFTHEPEFAEFLRKSIFSIEILPLIHGPFLNTFLNSFEDRYIRFAWQNLSKSVKEVIQRSVSKNRFRMIMDSPSIAPKPGESLSEQIEKEIYKRFARKIYFEEGSYFAYKEISALDSSPENPSAQAWNIDTFSAEDSGKYELVTTKPYIELEFRTDRQFFFRTKAWLEVLRFDWILSPKHWEPLEFHRLPPQLVLEIPLYMTGQYLIGAGITQSREPFEFALQWF